MPRLGPLDAPADGLTARRYRRGLDRQARTASSLVGQIRSAVRGARGERRDRIARSTHAPPGAAPGGSCRGGLTAARRSGCLGFARRRRALSSATFAVLRNALRHRCSSSTRSIRCVVPVAGSGTDRRVALRGMPFEAAAVAALDASGCRGRPVRSEAGEAIERGLGRAAEPFTLARSAVDGGDGAGGLARKLEALEQR